MLLITSLDALPDLDTPCGLTIGSFDGVHLGHQALLTHLRSELLFGGTLAVLTFSNHPSHYFTPNSPSPLIYPPHQKIHYLKECGVDLVILLPFDAMFSQTPYDQFLTTLTTTLRCTHLILGTGAAFGKEREGNEANVRRLAPKLGITVDYLPKFMLDGLPVSSGRIRSLIAEGNFGGAKECLGRPWSLKVTPESREALDQGTVSAAGLCLPPEGTYPVTIKVADALHLGKAHVAPGEYRISLEFRDPSISLFRQEIEIFFAGI
jgi:riboflavin kinase/FMN adenylyltransferase